MIYFETGVSLAVLELTSFAGEAGLELERFAFLCLPDVCHHAQLRINDILRYASQMKCVVQYLY